MGLPQSPPLVLPADVTPVSARMFRDEADAHAADLANQAANLTARLKTCLDAAGQNDAAAASALTSAHASAAPDSPAGGTELGTLGGYQPMSGVWAPQLLLDNFAAFDSDGDGRISLEELHSAAGNGALPAELRDAARYFLEYPDGTKKDNATLFSQIDRVNGTTVVDSELTRTELSTFVEMQPQVAALAENFGAIETAAKGGRPDGLLSHADLVAAAASPLLAPAARNAARWMLDHLTQLNSVNHARGAGSDKGGFSHDDLIKTAFDSEVFTGDPDAAMRFVRSLPLPARGGHGLPIGLVSVEGFRATAGSALIGAGHSIVDRQQVVSHLPEDDNGDRNYLISATYYDLGHRMQDLLAGPNADPKAAGFPGVNWMMYAPMASDGLHTGVDGSFNPAKIFPAHWVPGEQQAAADGNQWIFNSVGGAYARFLDLYDTHGGSPTPAQLHDFLDHSFRPEEGQLRSAMAAYAEIPHTTDPVARQILMYKGNVLSAATEQAGVQPYLEKMMRGPDGFETGLLTIPKLGDAEPARVYDDVSDAYPGQLANNLIHDLPPQVLDPAGQGPEQLAPHALAGQQPLAPLSGVESYNPGFPVSPEAARHAGSSYYTPAAGRPARVPEAPPNDLRGTAAGSWPDANDRMNYLYPTFRVEHTSAQMTDDYFKDFGYGRQQLGWLPDDTGLRR